jgi:hypothetical protein
MRFNKNLPFVVFMSFYNERSFYRRTFEQRFRNFSRFFSGSYDNFGILEILLFPILIILLGLTRGVGIFFQNIGKLLEDLFEVLLLNIPAVILSVVFSPFIYLVHKLAQYRGRALVDRIDELQVVPIEPDLNVGENFGRFGDDNYNLESYQENVRLYEKKIINFYQENCLKTVPLKDHKVAAIIEHLRSDNFDEKFVLKRISTGESDENGYTKFSEIFGLFPSSSVISLLGYKVNTGYYARPLALVVPSIKNRDAFEAVIKYGIFSNYAEFCTIDFLSNFIEQDVLQNLNKPDPYHLKVTSALLSLLDARDTHVGQSEISNSLVPLFPQITGFAGITPALPDERNRKAFDNKLERVIQFKQQALQSNQNDNLYPKKLPPIAEIVQIVTGLGLISLAIPFWNFLSPAQSFNYSFISTEFSWEILAPICLILLGIILVGSGVREIKDFMCYKNQQYIPESLESEKIVLEGKELGYSAT